MSGPEHIPALTSPTESHACDCLIGVNPPVSRSNALPPQALLIGVNSLPFATLVAFFGMSILSGNQNINKLLRFNMLQAINFDIALIVPSVFGPLLTWSLGSDAYKISPVTDLGTDLITVSLVLAVVYSIGASATGTLPNKIPFFGRINRVTRDD